MSEDLAALRAACSAQAACTPEQAIAEGESRWFIGRAVPAARGVVAIAQPNGFRLTFRDDDILEVKRHKEWFFVRVSARSDLLLSFEQVVNARLPASCDCHRNHEDHRLHRAFDIGLDIDWGDHTINLPQGGCYIQIRCGYIDLPLVGSIYVCLPIGVGCR